jgi:hypothetical protein
MWKQQRGIAMTDEERQRLMDFILEQQVKFSANMRKLEASQARTNESKQRDKQLLDELKQFSGELKQQAKNIMPDSRSLTVNKRTHRIRFENETEDEVTIIIERH